MYQIDEALKEIEKPRNQTLTIRNAAEVTKIEMEIDKNKDRLTGSYITY